MIQLPRDDDSLEPFKETLPNSLSQEGYATCGARFHESTCTQTRPDRRGVRMKPKTLDDTTRTPRQHQHSSTSNHTCKSWRFGRVSPCGLNHIGCKTPTVPQCPKGPIFFAFALLSMNKALFCGVLETVEQNKVFAGTPHSMDFKGARSGVHGRSQPDGGGPEGGGRGVGGEGGAEERWGGGGVGAHMFALPSLDRPDFAVGFLSAAQKNALLFPLLGSSRGIVVSSFSR